MSLVLLGSARVDRECLSLFIAGCRARGLARVVFNAWTENSGNTYLASISTEDNSWMVALPSVGTAFSLGRVAIDVAVLSQALDCIPVSDVTVDVYFAQDGDAYAVRIVGSVADTTLYSSGIRAL